MAKAKENEVAKDEGGAVSETESQDEFREKQLAEARAQGQTAANAVPESRSPAFSEVPNTDSATTKKLKAAGLVDGADAEPMPKSAYDRANSDVNKKAAADASVAEALHVSDPIRVTDESSPWHGQKASIVRMIYDDDTLAKRQGQPSQRFLQPLEFEARTVGGPVGDQLMMLRPDQVERIDIRDWISS